MPPPQKDRHKDKAIILRLGEHLKTLDGLRGDIPRTDYVKGMIDERKAKTGKKKLKNP